MIKRLQGLMLILFLVITLNGFSNALKINFNFLINKCFNSDTGKGSIKVPEGFSATIVADNVGKARHIVISPKGIVYVKSMRKINGKGIFVLKNVGANAKLTIIDTFCNYGGTGIVIKDGYLYASSDEEVFRYKLNAKDEVINPNAPEKIVTGLIEHHQHETKSIALDNVGNIYVNVGAYANSCQEHDRTKGSPGRKPCPILDSAGGIWMFKADKLNQTYGDGIRYATGLRNVVGLDWNQQTNSLFVMQHGRDQLFQNWPQYYSENDGAEFPAECMYELHKGSNCGWPYIYFNQQLNKKMLAPEYGGDGKTEGDASFQDPVIAFPGHLAPNGLLFYTGKQFPEKYKNGAFIAFHGSWNRAPLPQAGYFVVFVPFKDGKPTGKWEVFADGFSGKEVVNSTRSADHRPCGLAQGPDGSLYVTDDSKGTVFKISYTGK